nr:hypothetical protein [Bacteroidaceae bacterium]
MKRILLIQPMKFWQMNSADVFLAKKEGDILTINGKITEEDLENEDDTHFLLKACDQLSEDCLYRDLGARKFKKQETFWNEADELIKAHTMTVAGKRLKECIKKANELNIPIYFRQNRDVNIYDSAPLLPTDDVLTPIMEFTGVDGNINYTLKLSYKDDVMTPCEHILNILSFSPAIVCIDNHISSMP